MEGRVQVFYDIERRKTKAWAFLGWTSRPMEIVFSRPPAVTRIRGRWDVGFISELHVVVDWFEEIRRRSVSAD